MYLIDIGIRFWARLLLWYIHWLLRALSIWVFGFSLAFTAVVSCGSGPHGILALLLGVKCRTHRSARAGCPDLGNMRPS